MFEKYHLIHYEVDNTPSENPGIPRPGHLIPDRYGLSRTGFYAEQAYRREVIRNIDYHLSGSVDDLPFPLFQSSHNPAMYLQSFSVVNAKAGSFTRRRDCNTIFFSYTLSGTGELEYDGEKYEITPGTGFVLDARKPHEFHTTGDHWEIISLYMWGSVSDTILQHFSDSRVVTASLPEREVVRAISRILDACIIVSPHKGLYAQNTLIALLCFFLETAEQYGRASMPDVYFYIIHYMESNYTRQLSLEELSSFANVSKYHFSREFKKYTDSTPNEYLIQLRIRHAVILLQNSDMPIEQVSQDAGFRNMSNFIQLFKKHTGLTPSAFRKSQAQGRRSM